MTLEMPIKNERMIISYRNFMLYKKNTAPDNRRDIIGVYKEKKTGKIIEGDNFSCINVDNDAEKSYKYALEYFNSTLLPNESEREFVYAKWKDIIGDRT